MKLVTYEIGGSVRIGLAVDDWIVDLVKVCRRLTREVEMSRLANAIQSGEMLRLLEGGEELLKVAAKVEKSTRDLIRKGIPDGMIGDTLLHAKAVRLMAPIPRPRKNIVCLGLNYKDHWAETVGKRGEPLPAVPVFFTKAPTAVIGPFDDVVYPTSTKELDYEVELAFVIGKPGKNIPREEAYDYVLGYTIMNDVTARDFQRSHVQWFRSKSLDTFAPLGPYLVTKDEIPEPQRLDMKLKVNNEVRQQSNTVNMIFKISEIVEILSSDMTLEIGDIIATGTPAGVGVGMTPPKYLEPGDVIETEIEGLGSLRNAVV